MVWTLRNTLDTTVRLRPKTGGKPDGDANDHMHLIPCMFTVALSIPDLHLLLSHAHVVLMLLSLLFAMFLIFMFFTFYLLRFILFTITYFNIYTAIVDPCSHTITTIYLLNIRKILNETISNEHLILMNELMIHGTVTHKHSCVYAQSHLNDSYLRIVMIRSNSEICNVAYWIVH